MIATAEAGVAYCQRTPVIDPGSLCLLGIGDIVGGVTVSGKVLVDRTVAHLNIEHYRKLLTQEMDEAKRQTILRLLAEGEAKFASLKNSPQDKASG